MKAGPKSLSLEQAARPSAEKIRSQAMSSYYRFPNSSEAPSLNWVACSGPTISSMSSGGSRCWRKPARRAPHSCATPNLLWRAYSRAGIMS